MDVQERRTIMSFGVQYYALNLVTWHLMLNHVMQNQCTYLGSVIRNNSLARRPMKLTDALSVGGNFGIGIVLL